ncbi:hypothetical protein CYMTET_36430 [Cymbomonas tetramitiformis]|uniref:Uncharacterized protein n=1 Tax=Cymbomonas tetramitiformis TaxID=36881 RepID=A0AAE0CHH9_9CHLO|nr:hypothetical protein CYMTET_36430 [Cymbomonas tetramitiformis]
MMLTDKVKDPGTELKVGDHILLEYLFCFRLAKNSTRNISKVKERTLHVNFAGRYLATFEKDAMTNVVSYNEILGVRQSTRAGELKDRAQRQLEILVRPSIRDERKWICTCQTSTERDYLLQVVTLLYSGGTEDDARSLYAGEDSSMTRVIYCGFSKRQGKACTSRRYLVVIPGKLLLFPDQIASAGSASCIGEKPKIQPRHVCSLEGAWLHRVGQNVLELHPLNSKTLSFTDAPEALKKLCEALNQAKELAWSQASTSSDMVADPVVSIPLRRVVSTGARQIGGDPETPHHSPVLTRMWSAQDSYFDQALEEASRDQTYKMGYPMDLDEQHLQNDRASSISKENRESFYTKVMAPPEPTEVNCIEQTVMADQFETSADLTAAISTSSTEESDLDLRLLNTMEDKDGSLGVDPMEQAEINISRAAKARAHFQKLEKEAYSKPRNPQLAFLSTAAAQLDQAADVNEAES